MANAFKKTLLNMVGPRIAQMARVADVQEISEHFRLIDMEVKESLLASLGPTDKVQLNTGEWEVRTYTPILQPHYPGRLRLLVHLHGQGPGSRWAQRVREGDVSHLVGPRPILQVGQEPFVLAGDDTSLATALNFKTRRDVHAVFESSHADETRQVLTSLGLRNAAVVQKSADGTHREQYHELVQEQMQALQTYRAVLTGHAQAIQQVGRALKLGGAKPELMTKPYWADNKQGLD